MVSVENEIAAMVDDWFQGEPTPERQQNMRRATLIADLSAYARRLREDFYSSNRVIHRLEAELAVTRAQVAEGIAQAIEADAALSILPGAANTAARIAREYGKGE